MAAQIADMVGKHRFVLRHVCGQEIEAEDVGTLAELVHQHSLTCNPQEKPRKPITLGLAIAEAIMGKDSR